MKKKKPQLDPLPDHLTYPVAIKELDRCKDTSFYTSMTEDGAFQVSHPGADYENFPDVALVVEREKGHFLEAGFAYLNARPWRLAERGYFLKIKGTVVSHADKDVRLLSVQFRADTVQLVKAGNSLSVKETWLLADQQQE